MEKLFFNKGLISGLILLGKVWVLNLAIALVKGPGSALENFAAIVNPEKPTKVNWTLSWPSALEICGKTVLYSGFNKRSDSFGKGLGFELGNCSCKRPRIALDNFAAIVNPEKPTKVNWTLSWPSALEICGKTVL